MYNMEINVHGMQVADAEIELMYALEECKLNGDPFLTIVHGYNLGTAIRDQVRSSKFLGRMRRNGYNLQLERISDKGKTTFNIKQ